ncbi:MAG: hypothetical protein Q9218_001741 [Villophora microphyllina]
MELYSDAENPQMADDGIDIDLDLASDPAKNEGDEEMVEDPDIDLEGDDQLDRENDWDDQMVDDTEQDDRLQYDDDLDTVGLDEPGDDQDLIIDDAEQVLQPPESSHTEVQDIQQDNGHHPNLANNNPHQDLLSVNLDASQDPAPEDGQDSTYDVSSAQDLTAISNEAVTEDLGKASDSTVLKQHQSEHDTHEPQSDLVGSESAILGVSADRLRTSDQEGIAGQVPGAAQTVRPSIGANGGLQQNDNEVTSSNGIALTSTDQAEKFGSSHTISQDSFLEPSNTTGNDAKSTPLNPKADDVLPQTGEDQDFQNRSHASAAANLNGKQEEASSQEPYIHPMTVVYEGSEMFLFPPPEQEQDLDQTYFLSDEALAKGSLHDLFRECRNTLGGSISDLEELQITIELLELSICESTVEVASTSLVDILEVFTKLHFRDGTRDPPPMRMILSTNIRFSDQLRFLVEFAAAGKGMSRLLQEGSLGEAISSEDLREPELTRKSDETKQKAVSTDVLDETSTQGDHEAHVLSHGNKQAEQPSNISPKLLTDNLAANSENAKSHPATKVVNSTTTVHSVRDNNVDSSATNLATEKLNDASSQHGLDELADDLYDDEVEDGEEVSQEDDADPKSIDSSTVQGDDGLDAKNNFDMSTEVNDLPGGSETGQQLAYGSHKNLDAEDPFTGADNLGNELDNLDDLEGIDPNWQDSEDADPASDIRPIPESLFTADLNHEGNSSSDVMGTDISLIPRMDADSQNPDILGRRASPSVEDDEIEFDDDLDEFDIAAEDQTDTSNTLHLELAGSSSPGALKRVRADTDVASLGEDPRLGLGKSARTAIHVPIIHTNGQENNSNDCSTTALTHEHMVVPSPSI